MFIHIIVELLELSHDVVLTSLVYLYFYFLLMTKGGVDIIFI